MAETFAFSFTATELNARSGISQVMTQLRDFDLPEERVGDVQIALAEAVNNVVEHAYSGQASGDICIKCNLSPQELCIEISDFGSPLPYEELPEGLPADVTCSFDSLPEGGFGWFLIRELTSDLRYQRQNDSNLLSLCFAISCPLS